MAEGDAAHGHHQIDGGDAHLLGRLEQRVHVDGQSPAEAFEVLGDHPALDLLRDAQLAGQAGAVRRLGRLAHRGHVAPALLAVLAQEEALPAPGVHLADDDLPDLLGGGRPVVGMGVPDQRLPEQVLALDAEELERGVVDLDEAALVVVGRPTNVLRTRRRERGRARDPRAGC